MYSRISYLNNSLSSWATHCSNLKCLPYYTAVWLGTLPSVPLTASFPFFFWHSHHFCLSLITPCFLLSSTWHSFFHTPHILLSPLLYTIPTLVDMPYLGYLPHNVPVLSVIGHAPDFSFMPLLFLAILLVAWPCMLLFFPLPSSLFFLFPVLFPLQGVPTLSFLFGMLFPQQGAPLFSPSSPTMNTLYICAFSHYTYNI